MNYSPFDYAQGDFYLAMGAPLGEFTLLVVGSSA